MAHRMDATPARVHRTPWAAFGIHTQDLQHRFKSVKFAQQGKGTWGVAVKTENTAPFRGRDSTATRSVTWRLNVFAGARTVPVDQYKRWAYEAHKIHDEETFRPKWVLCIRGLVIKHADYISEEQTLTYLDALRQHVEPGKTLLFNTLRRHQPRQSFCPAGVASERGRKRLNVEARNRGFRTMQFANDIGITPSHPRFAESNLCHQQCLGWRTRGWDQSGRWKAATHIRLYYVSPAHKPWRDYQVGQFKALLEGTADGLFIDQSVSVTFMIKNGLREGETTVDGNIAYHDRLYTLCLAWLSEVRASMRLRCATSRSGNTTP